MRITILLLVALFAFTLAKEEGEKKEKKEEKTEKKEAVHHSKKGPGSQFLYTVRQRLAALHLQLSVDFRALSACKSASCRAAARARIRDVKRAELLTRRARGHIRLGRIFNEAAACRNSACRQRLREAVREEQRDMRHLIRQGANERAANAKREAARLARRARLAAQHAHNAGKIAHHLNKHEKRERMHRFLHLAQHFHGLGLLYARAAECHSHRCAHRMLKKIQRFRKSQKKALERLHQRSVLDALKRARSASHALKHKESVWDSVTSVSEEDEFRHLRRHAKRLMRRAKHAVHKAKRHPDSFSARHRAARLVRAATAAMKETKEKAAEEEKPEEKEEEDKEDKEEKEEEEKKTEAVVDENEEEEKTNKAKEVSKKLAESAEKEIEDLNEESKKVSGSIKEKLEKKIDLDEALETEFKKAEECHGMDCIRNTVKKVKSIRFNAAQ